MGFLLSLVTPVVENLRDFLIDRVMLTIRVGDNVSALDHQVEILKQKRQDVKETIERDEPAGKVATKEVTGWLQNAEDLEKEAAAVSDKYRERNCRVPGGCSFNCWLSHSIGAEAVGAKAKVEAELQSIEHIQRTEYPPPPRAQEVPTATLGSDTGSEIRSKVDKALNFLRNDNQAVLGIWGMGGVGKTTVLQRINNALATVNDPSLRFHRVVFVTASRGCTVEKIQKQVAKELQLREDGRDQVAKELQLPEDGQDLRNKIFNFLNKRSFVVLLDDLWESLDLMQVGVPRLGELKHKHKLILATRDQKVCLDMGADPIEKVSCLDTDNARRLFLEKVGGGVISSHPLIPDLADKIADECGGLPIALTAIARAMTGKSRPELWEKALDDLRASKMSTISGGKDDPLSLLKVSYDYLQNPAWRECLLLCALWPEDFEIPEEDIIECWMGHGLLGDFNNMKEANANGYEIVDGLHKASLLEYYEDEYLRGVVRLHDLIRDMALWIARDSCGEKGRKWAVLSGVDGASDEALRDKMLCREAHKISLMKDGWLRGLPPDISAPNLVTLVVKDTRLRSEGLGSIQNFPNLTFLDLSSNELHDFPIEICRLSKLEYLNLSANLSISSLPRELEDLKRLKYLLLSNTAIFAAPRELFSSMDSLEVLDLSYSLQRISQGSIINNNLDGLRGRLKGLGINACSRRDMDKLSELSVPITRLTRWISKDETGPSLDLLPRRKHPRDPTWSNMIHLQVKGYLMVGRVRLSEGEVEAFVLEKSRLLVKTLVVDESDGCFPKRLAVVGLNHLEEIVWKGVKDGGAASLNMLASVYIERCRNLKHLSWLLNLPLLTVLDVSLCGCMEHVIRGEEEEEEEEAREAEHERQAPSQLIPPATFPSLRTLRLLHLWSLRSICNDNRAVSLPRLEHLQVFYCPSLKRLPFDTPASCSRLKKIEARRGWWEDTLELDGDMRSHLQSRFVEIQ